MRLSVTQACILATISALMPLSSAVPTQPRDTVEARAVKGPVIFLSNCFNSNGASYGEFDYYDNASNTVLNKKSSAPTLKNVINTSESVDYISGGTFHTAGAAEDFYAIISIGDDNTFKAGSVVGNGKSTTYFYGQICYAVGSAAALYSPSSSVKCTAQVYCVPGPAS